MPYQYAKYIMQNDFNSMDAGCNEVVLWISLKKQLTYYQLKCQHFTNTMYSYMIVTYVECGFFFSPITTKHQTWKIRICTNQ